MVLFMNTWFVYFCNFSMTATRLLRPSAYVRSIAEHEQKKEQQMEEPDDAFTLQALRAQGWTPERIRTDKLQLVLPSPPPPPHTIPHRE